MSKRDLKKYLSELDKPQLEEQITELYEKFKDVKVFYDFVFNPNEQKLADGAKIKIANEYFPTRGKWPKMRRGTAQKIIKHFITLGVDAFVIADVMLYNIEIAQTYSAKRKIKYEIFYKSMLNSYQQAMEFIENSGALSEFSQRAAAIAKTAEEQKWPNWIGFQTTYEVYGN